MFHLIKKLFCLSHSFQTLFHNSDHLLYYPQMSMLSFRTFFCSLISVFEKWNIETMLTFPYSYNWQKFNNKMNEKRSQEYQSMDPEYVIGQVNSCILRVSFEMILSFDFCTVSKILTCFSLIKNFPNDYKIYSSHLQV